MSDPLICCWTVTCNRPELLGRMIKCFEAQQYRNKYLVILDDLGQYDNQRGEQWELVSVPRRFRSLGEKNNACMAMAPRNAFGYAKMDDDDVYGYWYVQAAAEALMAGEWCQPREAIDWIGDRWVKVATYNSAYPTKLAYHGQWAYRRSFIEKYGGYHPKYAGDDGDFQDRLHAIGAPPSVGYNNCYYHTAYWYNRPLANRISERGGSEQAYWDSAPAEPRWIGKVPEWAGEEAWNREVPTERMARPW